MNNNTNLEEKALEVLATMFFDAGYRKGVKQGVTGCVLGMAIGAGVMLVQWIRKDGCFKKTENDE